MRKGIFCLLMMGMLLMATTAHAGYNEVQVAAGGNGIAVYTTSSGKKQAGILYNGFVSGISLEDENGLHSCWLTRDTTVWLDQEKAHALWPENSWQMTQEEKDVYPCHVFVGEVIREDAPVYTSTSHKHISATHKAGTLLRVCGEFGDDYFVEGWYGEGFIPKSDVAHYASLTRSQVNDSTLGMGNLEVRTVYTGGSRLAIGGSATGYSDTAPFAVEDGQQVNVLKYLGDWAQLAGGGFIETRFLDPNGNHAIRYATVNSSKVLNRLNVRWDADADSSVRIKLFSGAKVQVPSHTENWAAVYLTGTKGSELISGSAMMAYLVFDDTPVQDGCVKVRLKETVYSGNGGSSYYSTWTGTPLSAGTELTVIGVEGEYDMEWDNGDRFLCRTEDGRIITVWNGEGVLEPVEGTGIVVRTNTSVRFREKPHKEAKALRTLSSGSKVEILLRGEGWTMVQYKDQVGYVMSRYLNFP